MACDVDSSLKWFGFSVHLCSDPALCQYRALFFSVFCGWIYTSDGSHGCESWGLGKIGPMGVKIAQGLQEVHMDWGRKKEWVGSAMDSKAIKS